MILFIKHVPAEGPETLGDFFEKKGFKNKIIELYNKEHLPKSFNDIEAVIILGGPMNVYEEEAYPFLKEEDKFIKEILKNEIPYLGICLGAQLLAKAQGAQVVKSPRQEIGFSKIKLTREGQDDPLFKNLAPEIDVYQWHEDMFHIPVKGKLLAGSNECPFQVLKVGSSAYGLQFHVEITDQSIRLWSDASFDLKDPKLLAKKNEMLKDYRLKKKIFHQTADIIFENFLELIQTRKQQKIFNHR